MRMYQMYVCDHCGKESKNRDEIELCEATHFGLSVEEKHKWDALKSAARYFSSVIYDSNNEETRRVYDNTIDELVAFEQLHGLKNK